MRFRHETFAPSKVGGRRIGWPVELLVMGGPAGQPLLVTTLRSLLNLPAEVLTQNVSHAGVELSRVSTRSQPA